MDLESTGFQKRKAMKMRGYLLVSAVGLVLAGCFPFDGVLCTANFVYGVNVTVTAEDGTLISGATLTLVDGDHQETMEELGDMSPGVYIGAGERGGTYTLTVEADGFETATIEGIFVDENVCHVIGVARDVVLTAL